MKWMLLVLIYGTIPVKTGLLFDTIEDCLKAEEQMRATYGRAYNSWQSWAEANPKRRRIPTARNSYGGAMGWRRQGRASPMPSIWRLRSDWRADRLDNARAFC